MSKLLEFKNIYLGDYTSICTPEETKTGIAPTEVSTLLKEGKTFELGSIAFQKKVIQRLLLTNDKVDYIVGGDLSNQMGITSYSLKEIPIPYIGVYGACATFPLSLLVSASLLESGAKQVLAITSSSTQVAEKTFRYPNEYGSPKYKKSTKTATGACAAILTKKKTNIRLVNGLCGQVIDYKQLDANHLGAAMAPAAALLLEQYLQETNKTPEDFDLVLTGDLGRTGSILMDEFLRKEGIVLKNHQDAGSILYQNKECQGASGPAALPLVFLNLILKNKKYKRILMIGTGSLHTPSLMNQKETIPAIAHLLYWEVSHESN